jgi:hypothetical protein
VEVFVVLEGVDDEFVEFDELGSIDFGAKIGLLERGNLHFGADLVLGFEFVE